MDKELFDQIIEILVPEMDDANDRKALIQRALREARVLLKNGAAHPSTVQGVWNRNWKIASYAK